MLLRATSTCLSTSLKTVDFAEDEGDRFEAYFGLKEDLERAFAGPVDLVMSNAIRNPSFSARALATAEELYAA